MISTETQIWTPSRTYSKVFPPIRQKAPIRISPAVTSVRNRTEALAVFPACLLEHRGARFLTLNTLPDLCIKCKSLQHSSISRCQLTSHYPRLILVNEVLPVSRTTEYICERLSRVSRSGYNLHYFVTFVAIICAGIPPAINVFTLHMIEVNYRPINPRVGPPACPSYGHVPTYLSPS